MVTNKRIGNRLLFLISLVFLITFAPLLQVQGDPSGEDAKLADSKEETSSTRGSEPNVVPNDESQKEEQDSVVNEEGSGEVINDSEKNESAEEGIEKPEKEERSTVENSSRKAESPESGQPREAGIFTLGSSSLFEFSPDDEITEEELEELRNRPAIPLTKRIWVPRTESEKEMERLDAEELEIAIEKDRKERRIAREKDEAEGLLPAQLRVMRAGKWKRILSSDEIDSSDDNEPDSIGSPINVPGEDSCLLLDRCIVKKLEPGQDLSAAYERIDEEVLNSLRGSRPSRHYLLLLNDMFLERLSKPYSTDSKIREQQEEDIHALKYLVALDHVLREETICSLTSYIILWNNDVGLKGKGHRFINDSNEEAISKVLWLVRYYSQEHFNECKYRYADKFKAQLEQVDKAQLDRVKRVLSGFIEPLVYAEEEDHSPLATENIYGHTILSQRPIPKVNENAPRDWRGHVLPLAGRLWAVFVNGGCVPEERRDWRRIYEGMNMLAKENTARSLAEGSSSKMSEFSYYLRSSQLNPDDIKKFTVQYLLEPCVHYVDKMKEIFIPLEYDESMETKKEFPENGADKIDFYYGWAHYRICEFLIKNKDKVKSNIKKELVKILKHPKTTGTLI